MPPPEDRRPPAELDDLQITLQTLTTYDALVNELGEPVYVWSSERLEQLRARIDQFNLERGREDALVDPRPDAVRQASWRVSDTLSVTAWEYADGSVYYVVGVG